MSINVTHLRSFWAVARYGGFSSASEVLYVSQPTLTRQVKELEEGYGVLLFDRSSNPIKLTADGRSLYSIAENVFEEIQKAEFFLKQFHKAVLRIAAVTTDVTVEFVRVISEIDKTFEVDLSIMNSEQVYDAILRRQCDIGVLTLPEDNPEIESFEVGKYPLLALLPEHHELANHDDVSIIDLESQPIITCSPGAQSRAELDRVAKEYGVELTIAQQINSYEMIRRLVSIGLGVGVIGYTGITEQGFKHVLTIRECAETIPVHIACLAISKRVKMIRTILNVAINYFTQVPKAI